MGEGENMTTIGQITGVVDNKTESTIGTCIALSEYEAGQNSILRTEVEVDV